jgi:DNA-binding CsgD family transcriptional regulator
MNLVRIRAVESESEVAFAGLADACRPLLDHLASLPPRQRDALGRALAVGPVNDGAEIDRLGVGAATLGLLEAAASDGPLLLIVDDADWLDSESAAALLFAARRIEAEPIAVIIAGRTPEKAFAGHGFEELHLQGLEPDEALELLARAGCSPGVAAALERATRGNPLALVELPRMLTAGQLSGDEPLEEPLEVGPGVERAFAGRVAVLSEDEQGALLVAATSDTNDLNAVTRAVERLGLPARALQTAEAAGLVRLDGPSFEFRHPLVRSSVYHRAAAGNRRRAHGALADALAEADPERSAWHRAAAALAPDEEAAELLADVAARAAARGAYASAAAAHERAARLGDETQRLERIASAADAAWLGGQAQKAAALAAEGLSGDPALPLRADLVALQARLELHFGDQQLAYRWFVEAADLVEESVPEKAAAMLAEAVLAGGQFGGLELEQAAERLERLPHGDDPVLELILDLAVGAAASLRGAAPPPTRVSAARLDQVAQVATSPLDLYWAGRGFFMIGRNLDASRVARRAIDIARGGQATGLLPQLLRLRAAADYDRGEWLSARAAGAEAVDLAEELGQTTTACACLGLLAELESALGADDDCRRHAGRAVAIATSAGLGFYRERAERALGRLDLARGRLDEAAERLEKSADRLERDHNREQNVTPLLDLVEVNTRRGDQAGAEHTLERLLALGEPAMPGEDALIERCKGIAARQDGYAIHFERALERHSVDLFPFEQARTALCYGERLRRDGERKAAREQLEAAAATFASLGARPWLERAQHELRASGARLRAASSTDVEQLTPREAQIAAQVAEGKSNREVAAALYLTTKTVEFHLTRIYRKLGVRSRSELVRLMSE